MTINRLNQGTTNQVLVKAISGQTTNLLELQDSSGNVVSSIGPTGALGGTVSQPQGLVHINTTSFSAVSSQSINSVFSATYDLYKVFLVVESVSTNNQMTLRLRASGTDSSADYRQQVFLADAGTLTGSFGTATGVSLSGGNRSQHYASIELFNPFKASITQIQTSYSGVISTTTNDIRQVYVNHSPTNSYDGFTILPSTGNMTGYLVTFGYRK